MSLIVGNEWTTLCPRICRIFGWRLLIGPCVPWAHREVLCGSGVVWCWHHLALDRVSFFFSLRPEWMKTRYRALTDLTVDVLSCRDYVSEKWRLRYNNEHWLKVWTPPWPTSNGDAIRWLQAWTLRQPNGNECAVRKKSVNSTFDHGGLSRKSDN